MAKSLLRNNSQSPITLPPPYTGIIAPGDAVVLDDPPSVVAAEIGIFPELINYLQVSQVPDAQPVDGHDRAAAAAGILGALASAETPLDFNGQRLTNIGTPTAPSDATTKLYVDNAVAAGGNGTVYSVTSGNAYLTVTDSNVNPVLTVQVGTGANQVAAGTDSRFNAAPSTAGGVVYDTGTGYTKTAAGSTGQVLKVGAGGLPEWGADSTVPSGPAGGSLAGTYPNPTIAASAITNTEVSETAAIATSKLSGALTDVTGNGLAAFVDAATKAARTYYVAVDGDDANDGSLSKPFATVQAAHDAAAVEYTSGEYVLIEVGPGSFSGNINITRKNTLIEGRGHRAEMFATTLAGNIVVNPSSATQKFTDLVGIAGCFVSVPSANANAAVKATGSGLYSLILNDCYFYTNNATSTASALACDATHVTRPRVLANDCILATEQGGPAIMQLDRGDVLLNNTRIRHNSSVTLGSAGAGVNVLNDASLWANSCTVDTRSAGAAIVATGGVAGTKLLLTLTSVTTAYAGSEDTTHGITIGNTLGAAAFLWQSSFSVADVSASVFAINGSAPAIAVYGELTFLPGTNATIAPTVTLTPTVETHGTVNLPSLTASLPLKLNASKTVTAAAVNLSGAEVTGTLTVDKGGTGISTTPPAGTVAYGNGSTQAYTAVGTSGQPLLSAGAGAPAFGQLDLGVATNITGTLPAGNQAAQSLSGDLTGTTSSATVTALRGNPVKAGTLTAGDAGKVLTWSGSEYEAATLTPSGGGSGGAAGLLYYLNYGVAGEAPLPNGSDKQLSLTFSTGAATTPAVTAPNSGVYATLAQFVTPVDEPGATTIPPGLWDVNAYLLASHPNDVFFRMAVYTWDGTTLTGPLAVSENVEITSAGPTPVLFTAAVYVPQTVLDIDDRVVIRLEVTRTAVPAYTVTGYFGDGTPSHAHTTIGAPGGTGLVKVVDGIVQAPASLLVNADVDMDAAIVVSKLDGNAESGTANKVLHGSNDPAGPAVWGAVALGSDVSGQLPVANGGTGLASGTSGGVPYFNANTTMASSAALAQYALVLGGGAGAAPYTLSGLGTTSTVLHGNESGAPTFGAVSLTTDVSGTLPVANGGTNGTAAPTGGEVAYGTGSAYAFTSGSTAGYLLQSNGIAAPTWLNIVPVTHGGTGTNTTPPANQVPYGNALSTALVYTSGGSIGQVLGIGGSGNPEWISNSSAPSGTAGGDLSGTYPDPTVAKLNGTTITTAGGALTVGSVLRVTAGGSADWGTVDLGSAAAVSGTLAKASLPAATVYTDGSYVDPSWITSLAGSKVSGDISGNAANVTGTVAIANGGTGSTTAPTQGGVIYAATTTAYGSTADGAAGQYLKSNGTSAPTWADVPYDVAGMIAGQPNAAEVVFYFKATRAFTLSSTSSDHSFACPSANTSTGSAVFTVKRDRGGSVVTIFEATFSAGNQAASIGTVSNTGILAGDVIYVEAPATPDATLANVFWTLTGKL